jgi:hypothetical protein
MDKVFTVTTEGNNDGVMSSFKQTLNSTTRAITTGAEAISETTGLVLDVVEMARDALASSKVELKVEKSQTLVAGVRKLMDLGLSNDEAVKLLS